MISALSVEQARVVPCPAPRLQALAPSGKATLIVVPLFNHDTLLGTLTVVRDHTEGAYTESDQAFLQNLGRRGTNLLDTNPTPGDQLDDLRIAVESASDALVIANLEGQISYHNASFVNLFEYTAESLNQSGGLPTLFTGPDVMQPIIDSIRRGQSWSGDIELQCQSGRLVPVFLRANAIYDTDGHVTGFTGICTDLTERRLALEVARESDEMLGATFNQAAVGVAQVDVEGRWIQVNDRLCEILGYTREELLSEHVRALVPTSEVQAYRSHLERFLSGAIDRLIREKQVVRKDGQTVWVNIAASLVRDADQQPKYFVLFAEDVTERRRINDALQESEERYRSFVSAISEAIWCYEIDPPMPTDMGLTTQVLHIHRHARLIECNAMYAAEVAGTGVEPNAILGKPIRDLFDLAPERFQFFSNFVRDGYRTRNRRYSDVDAAGERRHFMANVFGVVRDERLVRIWGSRVDATETVGVERQVLNALEQQQQRIGQDLHDSVGQLLTAVRMLSEQLADDLTEREDPGATLAQKVVSFAQDAMTQTRRVYRGLTPIMLQVEGLIPTLQELAESLNYLPDVTCTFEADDEVDIQDTDTWIHIYRIMQEGAHNAIKHGKAKNLALSITVDDESYTFRVADDGRGFNPSEVNGHGMGLSGMLYRSHLIGAILDVQSQEGEGTSLACTLPRN